MPTIIIECDTVFKEILRDTIVDSYVKNVAGLMYDRAGKCIWLINDWNDCVVTWDCSNGLGEKLFLDNDTIDLDNPEGIAIDSKNRRMYVVTDAILEKPRLYVYSFNDVPVIQPITYSEKKYRLYITQNSLEITIRIIGLKKDVVFAQLYNSRGSLIENIKKEYISHGDFVFKIAGNQKICGILFLRIFTNNESFVRKIVIRK